MGKMILISGGCRSGKSNYAQCLAGEQSGVRVFIATCAVLDDEMHERVRRHQESRGRARWTTIEEPIALEAALKQSGNSDVVLVDCLTLWISNLLCEGRQDEQQLTEDDVGQHCEQVLAAVAQRRGLTIFFTNEVGLGIIPDNALARRFRNLAGRGNQVMAGAADTVILMVSGYRC